MTPSRRFSPLPCRNCSGTADRDDLDGEGVVTVLDIDAAIPQGEDDDRNVK